MFIALHAQKVFAPFAGAELRLNGTTQLNSAPANGAGFFGVQDSINISPLQGEDINTKYIMKGR